MTGNVLKQGLQVLQKSHHSSEMTFYVFKALLDLHFNILNLGFLAMLNMVLHVNLFRKYLRSNYECWLTRGH